MKTMPFHNLKMISQSYIISHLNYCNLIYYGIIKSKINYIYRILRIIERMIYGFKRKDHNSITEYLKSLGWLEMRNYSAYRILCLTYIHTLYAKHQHYLYDIWRFSVLAPVLWNNLPLILRRCNSIKTFKKTVKKHPLCSKWDLRWPCPLYLRWCSSNYSDHNIRVL